MTKPPCDSRYLIETIRLEQDLEDQEAERWCRAALESRAAPDDRRRALRAQVDLVAVARARPRLHDLQHRRAEPVNEFETPARISLVS